MSAFAESQERRVAGREFEHAARGVDTQILNDGVGRVVQPYADWSGFD